jgi:heme A synthase
MPVTPAPAPRHGDRPPVLRFLAWFVLLLVIALMLAAVSSSADGDSAARSWPESPAAPAGGSR